MQFLDFGLIQIGILLFHGLQVLETILIQEIEQVEQFTDVIVQRCPRKQYTVHRVEGFEIVEYFTIVRFD